MISLQHYLARRRITDCITWASSRGYTTPFEVCQALRGVGVNTEDIDIAALFFGKKDEIVMTPDVPNADSIDAVSKERAKKSRRNVSALSAD